MAHAMAENLALMQELTWPFAGAVDLASGTIAPFPARWPAWGNIEVRRWLDLAKAHSDYMTDADIQWVEAMLHTANDALGEPFQPCFVMHDYTEMNVALQRTGAGRRVSGIFDLMEAFVGDGEIDLSRQALRYMDEDVELARAFVERYRQLRPVRAGFAEHSRVYALWDRLVVWDFFQRPERETPWDPALTLRAWLEPILDAFGSGMEA
jgi:hygromycin-B 7''-O-kinase